MTKAVYKTDKNMSPSFSQLLQQLRSQDESLHRYVVDAKQLCFRDGNLLAGPHVLRLSRVHFAELCAAVNAPHAYLSRLGEPYSSYLLGRHFKNGDHLETLKRRRLLGRNHRHIGRVAVVARDRKFIGLVRPDLQTLRAADVLDQIQKAGGEQLKDTFDSFIVREFSCDDVSFQLTVTTPSVSHEVTVGDVIEGGLHIRHSLIHATQIEAYIHRLECANGAVRRECVATAKRGTARIRRRHTNRLDSISQSLRGVFEHTQRVLKGLRPKLEAVSKLRTNKLDGDTGVRRFVDTQLRQMNRLHSRRLLQAVMDAWVEDGRESTAYGAWNAITHTATHAPDSQLRPTVRRALFHLGGILGTRAEHICPHCYRMTLQ